MPGRKPYKRVNKTRVLEMLKQGISIREIAQKFDVTQSTIKRYQKFIDKGTDGFTLEQWEEAFINIVEEAQTAKNLRNRVAALENEVANLQTDNERLTKSPPRHHPISTLII